MADATDKTESTDSKSTEAAGGKGKSLFDKSYEHMTPEERLVALHKVDKMYRDSSREGHEKATVEKDRDEWKRKAEDLQAELDLASVENEESETETAGEFKTEKSNDSLSFADVVEDGMIDTAKLLKAIDGRIRQTAEEVIKSTDAKLRPLAQMLYTDKVKAQFLAQKKAIDETLGEGTFDKLKPDIERYLRQNPNATISEAVSNGIGLDKLLSAASKSGFEKGKATVTKEPGPEMDAWKSGTGVENEIDPNATNALDIFNELNKTGAFEKA